MVLNHLNRLLLMAILFGNPYTTKYLCEYIRFNLKIILFESVLVTFLSSFYSGLI